MLLDFNLNYDNKDKLFSLYDGYIKGNMFESLYKPYKNYKEYDLVPKTKKEEELYELMMLEFAINDLNLYLIINEDNKELFTKYKYYIDLYNKKKNEYESKYNMLNFDNEKNTYTYINNPLPWEVNNV